MKDSTKNSTKTKPSKTKKKLLIPVSTGNDVHGPEGTFVNQLTYGYYMDGKAHGTNGIKFIEAPVFYATLRFDRLHHRDSSTSAYFIDDENEKTYRMFLADFEDLLKDPEVDFFKPCTYRCDWTVIKRGNSFGIKHLKPQ